MMKGDSGDYNEPLLGNEEQRQKHIGQQEDQKQSDDNAQLRRKETISIVSQKMTVNVLPQQEDLNRQFQGNRVQTSKYTAISFLPKNLAEQFSKMANIYFLFITCMQMVPVISISGGKPAMLVPLTFVILVSMIKDIFEDYKRHKSDRKENYKQSLLYDPATDSFKPEHWRNLKVGQVVKVQCDKFFPADMLLIGSSEAKGVCYIETKNLDGETNLKHKTSQKNLNKMLNQDNNIRGLSGKITCAAPNDQIYKFDGSYQLQNGKKISVGYDNFLLRGSSLRNTDWVVGVIVYAGHQTKIMMNSANARYKASKIERTTNKQIIIVFILQLICCSIGAIYGATWMKINLKNTPYMQFETNNEWNSNWFLLFLKTTGTWLLIFTNFVPISLLVTLELVKFWQALFISYEWRLYDIDQDLPAGVQSSNLNEELGQVKYVFSDKTGTLTCNIMEFKKFSAGPVSYGESNPPPGSSKIDNVNFTDEQLYKDLKDEKSENYEYLMEVLLHLAVCHSIVVDERKGKYNASSPDELALVNAAKFFGVVFEKRDEDNNIFIDVLGKKVQYKLLNILEFTSTRKRMSVIVQDSEGKLLLLCKGADSVILERLNKEKSKNVKETLTYIEDYAKEGLRTLLLAQREIDQQEYDKFNQKFAAAIQTVINREEEIAAVNETIEIQLELIGSTAIEDKLQEGVSETIQFMKDAGIKVWVLTGDKIETAINIGYSSGLLDNDMFQFLVTGTDTSTVFSELAEAYKKLSMTSELISKSAIIVGGESLLRIENNPKIKENFLQVVEKANVVLACRVSPKQKADVVNMVRQKYPNKTTLSIGDGANDVSMITAAHVGIGISGKEGQQAARSSDFVIGQFQFLKTLMFVHGREAYRRNAFTVCYIFYKNALFVLPQYWFGFASVFSGQTLYEPWIYQLYNISFTALPIMWYALFDYQYPKEKLLKKPKLYRIGMKDECFGMSIFWRWVFYGAWQAFILLWICFVAFERTTSDYGQTSDLWMSGSIIYAAVVIVANIKLLDSFNVYTFWGEFLILFSMGSYFFAFWAENRLDSVPLLFGKFRPVMDHPVTYSSLFFCGMSIFTIDTMIQRTKKYIDKKLKVKEIIKEELEKAYYKFETVVAPKQQKHHGFAFSEEQHSGPSITRKLSKAIARKASKANIDQSSAEKLAPTQIKKSESANEFELP